jgi:DeoR/GlpR family transcriptional regulator of sugar metabolism
MEQKVLKRQEAIEQLLLSNETMPVMDIANALHVTPETIRKDLNELEEKGFLIRNHGYASLTDNRALETPMELRVQDHPQAKKAISQASFPYIQDGMMLYLCASSTNVYLARLLRIRKNLTVFTNSVDVLELAGDSDNKIILLGGELSPVGRRCIGMQVLDDLQGLHFDIAFLGMDGCKNLDGPGYYDYEDSRAEEYCGTHSSMSILMADASKFDKEARYQWASFDKFDVLITNHLKDDDRKRLENIQIVETGDVNEPSR